MQQRNDMSYSSVRILTMSLGAWPYAATPLRPRRCRWSSPEGGSFPSLTLRPPLLGRPSSSFLAPLEGERFLLPPPRLHGRSASRIRRTTSPTPPYVGNSWPSSWPSSPAPHKVSELAASLSGHWM